MKTKTVRLTVATAAATSMCLLQGCGEKPPSCSDPAVLGLMKQVVADAAFVDDGSTFEFSGMMRARFARAKPEHMTAFLGDLNVSVSGVTSNGYDSGAQMQRCAGAIEVTHRKLKVSSPMQYTVQVESGSTGSFVVRTSDLTPVVRKVQMAAIEYLNVQEAAERQ